MPRIDSASDIPPPTDLAAAPRQLLTQFAHTIGESAAAAICADLLEGAAAATHASALPYLAGRPAAPMLEGRWGPDYWLRVWGARGLLYVWNDRVAPAVVAGIVDEQWRVAEMCLKVAARRELGEAGPGAERLMVHERPRVRQAALRALGVVGDTEHVAVVRTALNDDDFGVRRAAARALRAMVTRLDVDLADDVDLGA